MTKEQKEVVENALVKFIVRASAEEAAPEEIRTLPAVVDSLVYLLNYQL